MDVFTLEKNKDSRKTCKPSPNIFSIEEEVQFALCKEWDQHMRSVGRHIFVQYEEEAYKHALGNKKVPNSGTAQIDASLELIFGLSVFLGFFYARDTERQSHTELITNTANPSLAIQVVPGVSVEIFGCLATNKYL